MAKLEEQIAALQEAGGPAKGLEDEIRQLSADLEYGALSQREYDRLDDEDDPGRKYRWLPSRDLPNGTRSYSWVHVTGDTTKKRPFSQRGR